MSFSQGHSKGDKNDAAVGIQWEFLNLMLKSVGVTLTEIQDVTFKFIFLFYFILKFNLNSDLLSSNDKQNSTIEINWRPKFNRIIFVNSSSRHMFLCLAWTLLAIHLGWFGICKLALRISSTNQYRGQSLVQWNLLREWHWVFKVCSGNSKINI